MHLIRFVDWGIRIHRTAVEGIYDEGAVVSSGAAIVRAPVKGGKCYQNGDGNIYGIWHFPNGKDGGKMRSHFRGGNVVYVFERDDFYRE